MAARPLLRYLRAAVEGVPARDGLAGAARAYVRFALRKPRRFSYMFHSQFDRQSCPEHVAAYSEAPALLRGLLQAHEDLKTDAETAGELVWASIHGIAGLGAAGRLRKGKAEDLEALADGVVQTLLAGMRAGN